MLVLLLKTSLYIYIYPRLYSIHKPWSHTLITTFIPQIVPLKTPIHHKQLKPSSPPPHTPHSPHTRSLHLPTHLHQSLSSLPARLSKQNFSKWSTDPSPPGKSKFQSGAATIPADATTLTLILFILTTPSSFSFCYLNFSSNFSYFICIYRKSIPSLDQFSYNLTCFSLFPFLYWFAFLLFLVLRYHNLLPPLSNAIINTTTLTRITITAQQ